MNYDFKPKVHEWQGSGWKVYTAKGPISSAQEIEKAEHDLSIPMPEMIFGKNEVGIEHSSGFKFVFKTFNALDLVDKTGKDGLIQVAHSAKWLNARQRRGTTERSAAGDKVEGIIKPFDWTYSTSYKGECSSGATFDKTEEEIPFDKLKRPDPILFFDDVTLYEDELGDNGIVSLNVKVRVMPERLLVLSRFFLRVDDVLFRVRDTRVFVEFAEGKVIREYQEKEQEFASVKRKVPIGQQDAGPFLRDANWVSQKIPVVKQERECIIIMDETTTAKV